MRVRCMPLDATQEDPTPGGAKKSGWGDAPTNDDESTTSAAPPRRRRAPDADDDDEDENTRKHDAKTSSNKHDIAEINDDDNDTIANLIPDLEDEQEDMARQVAEAPHLTKSRVQSIKVRRRTHPRIRCGARADAVAPRALRLMLI